MARKGNILVGTIGQGVMTSTDDGENWTRASVRQGMHSDCIVRALLPDPRRPDVVYAGTDMGLYRSDDAGGKWRPLDNPMRQVDEAKELVLSPKFQAPSMTIGMLTTVVATRVIFMRRPPAATSARAA